MRNWKYDEKAIFAGVRINKGVTLPVVAGQAEKSVRNLVRALMVESFIPLVKDGKSVSEALKAVTEEICGCVSDLQQWQLLVLARCLVIESFLKEVKRLGK